MDAPSARAPAIGHRGGLLRERRLGAACAARRGLGARSALHFEGGGADRRAVARGVLPPDLELDLIAFDLRHSAAAAVRPPRLVDASIAHLERRERPATAEPVRHELA